jgi:hypothetical protein
MCKYLSIVFVGVLTVVLTGNSFADLVITSEVVLADPGAPVSVDFFAADPDGVGEISSANLPVDVSFMSSGTEVGFGMPADLSFGADPVTAPAGGLAPSEFIITPAISSFFDYDIVANLNSTVANPPIAIGAAPVHFFTLNFNVSAAAVPGSVYNLTLVDDSGNVPSQFQISGTDLGTPSLSFGQIIINDVAIPEPALGGVLFCTSLLLLRRKRS